jgi:hypothetical protein
MLGQCVLVPTRIYTFVKLQNSALVIASGEVIVSRFYTWSFEPNRSRKRGIDETRTTCAGGRTSRRQENIT